MRLLLDEMFSLKVAVELRALGHDVVAGTERPALRGLEDEQVLESAWRERRALVTADMRGFIALAGEGGHHGVLFVPRRSLPRRRGMTGLLVRALDAYLRAHPHEDALVDRWEWLGRPEDESES